MIDIWLNQKLRAFANWLFPDEEMYMSRIDTLFMRSTGPFGALPVSEVREQIQWPYSGVYFYYMISKEPRRYKVIYYIEQGTKTTYIRRMY